MNERDSLTRELRAGADRKMITNDDKNVHGFLSQSSGLHDFLLTQSSGLPGDLTACTPENACGSDRLDS